MGNFNNIQIYIFRMLICVSAMVTAIAPVKASADDHAQMLQLELRFGGKQMESNLYLSLAQPAALAQFDSYVHGSYRVPVVSSDPSKLTLLGPFTRLFANEEAPASEGGGYEEPNPNASAGNFVGGVLLMALAVAPFAAALSSSTSFDPCSEGCDDIAIDLPDPSELPQPSTSAAAN
jgi:hypothetical protein